LRNARALAAAFGVFGLWWGSWAACLPAVQRSVGATTAQLGLALLAIGLGALPAMLLVGRVADRLGTRLVAPTLLAFAAAGSLPGFAGSPQALGVLLAVVGATSGSLDVAVNAAASDLESRRRIRVLDGLHAAFSAGVLCGGAGTGFARNAGATPREILPAVALVVAAAAIANRGVEPAPGLVAARAASLVRRLLGIGAILAVAFMIEGGLETWSAVYLERTLDADPAVSGLGPGLFAAAMAVGRALAQRVAAGPPLRIAFAGTAAAAGLATAVVAPDAVVALVGFAVAGGGLALSAPTLFGVAGRIAGPGLRGTGVSTVAVLGYVGFLAGPPLFGAVAGATGFRGGFLLLCGGAVLLAISAIRVREPAENKA
jgi:Major Facilitator Superfamily